MACELTGCVKVNEDILRLIASDRVKAIGSQVQYKGIGCLDVAFETGLGADERAESINVTAAAVLLGILGTTVGREPEESGKAFDTEALCEVLVRVCVDFCNDDLG